MEDTKTTLFQSQADEARFIDSFRQAMKQFEEKRKALSRKTTIARDAYDELKDAGNWNAEWVAAQYVLIVAKQSKLSARLRKFIVFIAYGAQQIFDKNEKEEENKSPQSV